jgi:CheY-like chemotaxis protein
VSDARRRVVLVVDDEPSLRALLRGVLRIAGYDVREAASGEEALEILDRETPDAVLLDILLPGIDGWEVLDRLKPRLATLPVLVLSASTGPMAYARAEAAGCRGFVEKPFQVQELIARLHRLVPPS